MRYDAPGKQYVLNPGGDDQSCWRIRDQYDVSIRFEPGEFSSMPQVQECGGRLDQIVRDKRLKSKTDLHMNPGGAACLCVKFEEGKRLPNGFNVPDFFQNLVIPFFYAQSYFARSGVWPWGEYGHGCVGYLEAFAENEDSPTIEVVQECLEVLRKYLGDWPQFKAQLQLRGNLKIHEFQCFCGSGRKVRKCHPKAFYGLRKLKVHVESHMIGL
jgi:hypothetical protein